VVKYSIAVAALSLGLVASMPASGAVMGFSGAWAPATWTTAFVGDVNPPGPTNNGSVNTAGAPSTIVITGGDDPGGIIGCVGGGLIGCEIQWNHAAIGRFISFNWSYTTTDSCGPQCDEFGVLLNGTETFLSDPGSGQSNQSGTFSTGSASLSSFGFFVSTIDGIGGPAVVTITNFQVPEPGSVALLGLGLAALALRRRVGNRGIV
jgi:hypothetical protein